MAAGILSLAIGISADAADAAVQPATFVADQVHQADPAVEQVSYTVSQSGHKFTWKAYQPKPGKKVAPMRATAAQYTTPSLDQILDPPASATDLLHPMKDPFGDTFQATDQPPLPDVQLDLSDQPPMDVSLSDLLPAQTDDEAPNDDDEFPLIGGVRSADDRRDPTLEGLMVQKDKDRIECAQTPDDVGLDPIGELKYTTSARLEATGFDPKKRPKACELAGGEFLPRQFAPTTFMWQASGLCHKPAYFEDVHLERYGHSWGPYVQPVMSGAHFFLNVPVLPYKMGLTPPGECVYTLGYYRPGSCAPYLLDPLPLSVRAGLAEAGAIVGLGFLIP